MLTSHTPPPARDSWPRWLYVVLFLALGLFIASTNWGAITRVNFEVGDFAANSLLIQDAKSLHLIYGNYSRVGFNHPGPAILYALAAGELLFNDWMHAVGSPFSGQLLAVGFYSAGWLLLLFALLRCISASSAAAALCVSGFMLAVTLCDNEVLAGIWFPDLYLLPFAAMMVALSRLVYGQTDMLRALAVSSGFLINGHVSFIAILGLMLVLVLGLNFLLSRDRRGIRVISAAFLRRHRRVLLQSAAILALFLLPLAIATVRDFPGPLYDYVKFSHGNKGNAWLPALRFVVSYWGGGVALLMAASLLGLLYYWLGGDAAARSLAIPVRALLAVMLAATLGLLYYAKVGIDELGYKYIGLFYYAVPALAIGLAILGCYHASHWRHKRWLAAVLSLLSLVIVHRASVGGPQYQNQFNQAGMGELYQSIKALPSPHRRVVLDLEQGADWGMIWSNILGLQAYAARRHDDLICVADQWHISFTKLGRCRPDELDGLRYFVRKTGAPDPSRGDPAFISTGLSFFRVGPPVAPHAPYVTVQAQPQLYAQQILRDGWSRPEGDFAWSVGLRSTLELPAPAGPATRLMLDVATFEPKRDSQQTVAIYVNSKLSGTYGFTLENNRKQIAVPLDAAAVGQPLRITLQIGTPLSPLGSGMSADPRVLGVALYGYRMED